MNFKLILASQSFPRKRLLKKLGIPFHVISSKVKEYTDSSRGCAVLVKKNALLKALDVSSRLKEGIVIGSDTLVYAKGKRIIGKPKNLKEAKKSLKMLSQNPHWVYSGIAIVDAKTKKKSVGFEKTKIYMTPLSDQEIDNYYKITPPGSKAGGFDIEGRGAFFIRRIEGCYFNVVGLPMVRLKQMLKKFGVKILMLLVCVYFSGCMTTEYNLATQQQETLFFGTEKEVAIGDSLARYINKEYEINTDIDVNERVSRIAKRIEDVSDRVEIFYTVQVINKDEVNAFALPGGFIYLYKGLVDAVDNDDQLAGVIAHEIGHITAKHAMKSLQAQHGYNFLQVLAITTGNSSMAPGINLAFGSILTGYAREDEFLADRLSVKYMEKAGYDPNEMKKFLEKLHEINAKKPIRRFSYWRTHPATTQRISVVNQEITGETTFRDYIRLTEKEGL